MKIAQMVKANPPLQALVCVIFGFTIVKGNLHYRSMCQSDQACSAIVNARCYKRFPFCRSGNCMCKTGTVPRQMLSESRTIKYTWNCLYARNIGESCDPEGVYDTCLGGSECLSGRCLCGRDKQVTSDGLHCKPSYQSELGGECRTHTDCFDENVHFVPREFHQYRDVLRCSEHRCTCPNGYVERYVLYKYKQQVYHEHEGSENEGGKEEIAELADKTAEAAIPKSITVQTYQHICHVIPMGYPCTYHDHCRTLGAQCLKGKCNCDGSFQRAYNMSTFDGHAHLVCAHLNATTHVRENQDCNSVLSLSSNSARICAYGMQCVYCDGWRTSYRCKKIIISRTMANTMGREVIFFSSKAHIAWNYLESYRFLLIQILCLLIFKI